MKKIIRPFLFLGFFIAGVLSLQSQTTNTHADAWFLMLNHLKFHHNWSVGNEFHLRRTDFVGTQEQVLIRPYVNYHGKNWIGTAGYTYISNYPWKGNFPSSTPEHNVWEQITLNHKIGKLGFFHRYRMEHRFRGQWAFAADSSQFRDGFAFANRFRYRITLRRNLAEKWFVEVFDEIWLNFSPKMQWRSFDRNWWYVALAYRINPNANVRLAYLHQWNKIGADIFDRHPTLQVVFQWDFVTNGGKE